LGRRAFVERFAGALGTRGHYRRIDAAGEVAGKHFHPLLLK